MPVTMKNQELALLSYTLGNLAAGCCNNAQFGEVRGPMQLTRAFTASSVGFDSDVATHASESLFENHR